jgi:homoserine kinase
MMQFQVKVPATTANIGPGFDCLGMAFDLENEVLVRTQDETLIVKIEGVGEDILAPNENNAIYQAMLAYANAQQALLPAGITLECLNRIPLGSGLGSSSAAAVAGILIARTLLGKQPDLEAELALATRLEGHPDNVAPCLMGGLVAATMNDAGIVQTLALPVAAELELVLVHPLFSFPTKVARAALPTHVTHHDAVFNASRAFFLAEALKTGDPHLLKTSLQDRLHQPYRLPLIPGAFSAIEKAHEAGAIATVLSGAGPSLLAFSPSPQLNQPIAQAIRSAFAGAGLESETFFPHVAKTGAEVTQLE